MRKAPIYDYLSAAQRIGIIPNFYLSEGYLTTADVKCYNHGGVYFITADGWWLFPGIDILENRQFAKNKIWSDFANTFFLHLKPQLLDHEYIYDPHNFQNLTGSNWETFRKNIRKWPKTQSKYSYIYECSKKKVSDLLIDWLGVKEKEALDAEFIVRYILKDNPAVNKQYLLDENNNLVAINAWDENWKYINYRLCITSKKEPFLDEFARYLFYTSSEILNSGKLVNDGGDLGNENLAKFKRKLNPASVRNVWSYL